MGNNLKRRCRQFFSSFAFDINLGVFFFYSSYWSVKHSVSNAHYNENSQDMDETAVHIDENICSRGDD